MQLQQQGAKQSLIVTGQREYVPAQQQLHRQLPEQSAIATGQRESAPAQLLLQGQPHTHGSPDGSPLLPTPSSSASLQNAVPAATRSPHEEAPHTVQQLSPAPLTSSAKPLSRAPSTVATQQAAPGSSSPVTLAMPSQAGKTREAGGMLQDTGSTLPHQHAEAPLLSSPAQQAQQDQPVCSETSTGGVHQSLQLAAGCQPSLHVGSSSRGSTQQQLSSTASSQLPQLQKELQSDSTQQLLSSTASTQPPQLQKEMRRETAHRPQLQKKVRSDSTQRPQLQKEMPEDCSSCSEQPDSQLNLTVPQTASAADRSSSLRPTVLQSSYRTLQETLQPDKSEDQGVSRPGGLALLPERSQLALATQGSYSEMSRQGLEEDNCRLRRALAAIEQQLGMIRNQQVLQLAQTHHVYQR